MFYEAFADYHYRRNLRKENIKLCVWGIGFVVVGLVMVLICVFI